MKSSYVHFSNIREKLSYNFSNGRLIYNMWSELAVSNWIVVTMNQQLQKILSLKNYLILYLNPK